jgi:tetratricopeptide (TPR) repeat protein
LNQRLLLPAATLLFALGLTGCVSTITYVPNESNVHMSLTKARRVLAKNKVKVIDNQTLLLDKVFMGTWITEGDHTLSIPLKDIQVSSGHESCWYRCWPALQVPGNSRVFVNEPSLVAEAIYVVRRQAEKLGFAPAPKSEDALFEEAATAYLAAAVKPELDADTRRFKVQAEDALREKRFEDTTDLYGEALERAPWWPAGHYNRALVLSELKEYPDAIVEMKRYLRLAPDAENAGAAQDQVYKWEAKAKEG